MSGFAREESEEGGEGETSAARLGVSTQPSALLVCNAGCPGPPAYHAPRLRFIRRSGAGDEPAPSALGREQGCPPHSAGDEGMAGAQGSGSSRWRQRGLTGPSGTGGAHWAPQKLQSVPSPPALRSRGLAFPVGGGSAVPTRLLLESSFTCQSINLSFLIFSC